MTDLMRDSNRPQVSATVQAEYRASFISVDKTSSVQHRSVNTSHQHQTCLSRPLLLSSISFFVLLLFFALTLPASSLQPFNLPSLLELFGPLFPPSRLCKSAVITARLARFHCPAFFGCISMCAKRTPLPRAQVSFL